ncbi:MAG: protein kinase [Gemmatimonadales bacterium]
MTATGNTRSRVPHRPRAGRRGHVARFLATETELERQVVVKVLPPDLSAGINTDRFRREIQLAARLQHPHIVPLLAAGARGSLLYYTMPFIGGENLRSRITRTGELPVQEATKILREVADALSYAHSQGVVHRDIKPENILISGHHALVTDFGVSKALSSATAETSTDGPTLTSLGIALGTPAYMAPEQAAADPMVDARADIYALGVVGYELLSGRTPFAGLNQQQTLSAHITTQPMPVTQHRPGLPPGLGGLIMRCLEKHPSDRWQTADDLHSALEPYSMTSGATAPSQAVAKKPFRWTPQRIAVAAGILGILATGFIASTIAFRRSGNALAVANTRQVTSAPGLEIIPRVSPDGKLIAYSVAHGAAYGLYVRQLAGGRAITLTDSGGFPTWSPDGSQILYSGGNAARAYIVPALGGVPTPVPGLDGLAVCAWSNAGDRIACTELSTGSLVVAGSRGENRHTVPGTASGDGVMLAAWSADDRTIAFARGNQQFYIGENIGNLAPSSVWVVRSDGGTPVRISDNTHLNVSPVWTPDGAVLFVSTLGGNRDIYLQRISSSLAPRGDPVRLTTGLNAHTISIDRAGKALAYSVFNTVANISYDGKWLAYDSNINGNQDIFKIPVGGGEPQQLTHNDVDDFNPAWSPDGKEIAFHSLLKGNRDIYVMDASGGNLTVVTATPSEELAAVWLPDGSGLFYGALPDSFYQIKRQGTSPGRWGPPKFLGRIALAVSPDGRQTMAGAIRGIVCPDCEGGLYLVSPDLKDHRRIATPQIDKVIQAPGQFLWSRDSQHAFVVLREKDGTSSIWQIPVNGDPERRLLHLTDPNRQFYRTNLDADSANFYFNIGDRQSDVWTMELKKQ